jgi:hypothetical protein
VLVNGVPVVRDGRHTGARPGRIVRGPGWSGWEDPGGGEGNERAAELLRRMADEARPAEPVTVLPTLHPAMGCCSE